jgi:dTDP-4-dehydrorhamnose reductase
VTEQDKPEPADEYGRSKLAGEISYFPHLTIRCSFIGYPDPGERGLLAWFWNCPSPVPGYTKVLWNGLTTVALAHWIMTEGLTSFGLRHIHNPEIHNKRNILTLANKVWELGKDIIDVPEPQMSRVLVSDFKNTQVTKPLVDQMFEMKELGKKLWNFQSQLLYQ